MNFPNRIRKIHKHIKAIACGGEDIKFSGSRADEGNGLWCRLLKSTSGATTLPLPRSVPPDYRRNRPLFQLFIAKSKQIPLLFAFVNCPPFLPIYSGFGIAFPLQTSRRLISTASIMLENYRIAIIKIKFSNIFLVFILLVFFQTCSFSYPFFSCLILDLSISSYT